MRIFMILLAVLAGQAAKEQQVPMKTVQIEKPFHAEVHYTPEAPRSEARIVIDADWEELGPEAAVAVLNMTTDRASPRTMSPTGRQLTLWLDDMFPEDEYLADSNQLWVEILTGKGLLGRSPVFRITLL